MIWLPVSLAGQIDRRGAVLVGGAQRLDVGAAGERVAHAGAHLVNALAGRFDHGIAGIVDDVDVVAARRHDVGAAAAVEHVGERIAGQQSVELEPIRFSIAIKVSSFGIATRAGAGVEIDHDAGGRGRIGRGIDAAAAVERIGAAEPFEHIVAVRRRQHVGDAGADATCR